MAHSQSLGPTQAPLQKPLPSASQLERREALLRERAEANAALAQAEQACQSRFAVNRCMAQAKGRHREAVKQVTQEELAIDRAERAAKAQAKQEALAEKAKAHAERLNNPPPAKDHAAPRPAKPRPPRPIQATARPAGPNDPTQTLAYRQQQVAQARQAREQRRQEQRAKYPDPSVLVLPTPR